ncbi:Ovate protein family, C-terminal [Dillenia turbinata]|uniref:Transcription repressor n=1 Tax=Dillenia turbinata TaxID=194707 RepID=A0AAN8VJH1_9MAGN
MQGSREYYNKRPKAQVKGCRELCCSCRLSVSSSEEAESCSSDRYLPISSLAHAMVQERLDQMIREAQEERLHEQRRSARRERSSNSKFIVMVAMEKSSFDVREDFRESIMEMIMTNQIEEPKDLRRLLNCYISMNSEEYRRIILEVFHEVPYLLVLSLRLMVNYISAHRTVNVEPREN